MDYTITEEQKQIKSLIKQFCEKEIQTKYYRDLVEEVSNCNTFEEVRALKPKVGVLQEKMHDVGLRQIAVPQEYGGGGIDYLTKVIVAETMGYHGAREIMGTMWMMGGGLQKQHQWIYEQFMSDKHMILTGTNSEAASGVDVHLPYEQGGAVFADKDGDEWVINGDKAFSSNGPMSDLIMVLTRTQRDAPLSESQTMFWVKPDAPGVSARLNRITGPNLMGNAQFIYDNVRVTEDDMVGGLNQAIEAMRNMLSLKILSYTPTFGHIQKLYQDMREHAKQRVCGGKPIIQHNNVAIALAQFGIEIEKTRALLYRAAWETNQRIEKNDPVNMAWSMAVCSSVKTLAWNLGELGSEIYGGMAGTKDLPIEGFVRWALCILPSGMPRSMQMIKFNQEYEGKYNYASE